VIKLMIVGVVLVAACSGLVLGSMLRRQPGHEESVAGVSVLLRHSLLALALALTASLIAAAGALRIVVSALVAVTAFYEAALAAGTLYVLLRSRPSLADK
jgi:hypothetical protein